MSKRKAKDHSTYLRNRWITTAEASLVSGCGEEVIRLLVRKGEGPKVKRKSRSRQWYRLGDVEDWAEKFVWDIR